MHKILLTHNAINTQANPVEIHLTGSQTDAENTLLSALEFINLDDVQEIDKMSVNTSNLESFAFQKIVKFVLHQNIAVNTLTIGNSGQPHEVPLRIILESAPGAIREIAFSQTAGKPQGPIIDIFGPKTEVLLRQVRILDNTIDSADIEGAAGVYVHDNAKLFTDNATFQYCYNNKPDAHGGAIQVDNGRAQLFNSTFNTCAANTDGGAAGGKGGAIFIGNNSFVTLSRTSINTCQAEYGAGVYIEEGSTCTMRNCTIFETVATAMGNAIHITGGLNGQEGSTQQSTLYLHDSTIRDCGENSFDNATVGGAISIADNSLVEMTGGLITGNVAFYGPSIAHILGKTVFTMYSGAINDNNKARRTPTYGTDFDASLFPSGGIVQNGNTDMAFLRGESEATGTFNWVGGTIGSQTPDSESDTVLSTVLNTNLGEQRFKTLKDVRAYVKVNTLNLRYATLTGYPSNAVVDTSMSELFYGCTYLRSLDISGYNCSAVTDMSHLCGSCSSLTSINLTGVNTHRVSQMNGMFAHCISLQGVDFTDIDTDNVTTMQSMFEGCTSLLSPSIQMFVTVPNLKSISSMFKNCTSITSFDFSNLDFAAVTNMVDTFLGCDSVTTAYGFNQFNCNKLNSSSNKPNNVNFTPKNLSQPSLYLETNLTSSPVGVTTPAELKAELQKNIVDLTHAKLYGVPTSAFLNLSETFRGYPNLTEVDISSLDLQPVTSLNGFFYECGNLTKVMMPTTSPTNPIDMTAMFFKCQSLPSIDFGALQFIPTGMGHMFRDCYALSSLDLRGFIITSDLNVSSIVFNTGLNGWVGDENGKAKCRDKTAYDRLTGSVNKPEYIEFVY